MTEPIHAKTAADLDQFDQWAKEATPRPWSPDASQILGANGERVFGMNQFVCEPYTGDPDTELLCQAVNALPALIAELRAARRVVEAARAYVGGDIDTRLPFSPGFHHLRGALADLDSNEV